MKLYIFHYHLLPGGVTGVIRSSVEAIREAYPEVEEIYLVTGNDEGIEEFAKLLPYGVSIVHIPEIGYVSLSQLTDPGGAPLPGEQRSRDEKETRRKREAEKLENRIRELLLSRCETEDALWWVHNYHLGKNPVFTNALLRLAEGRPGIRLLLQIHDFPEEARYANLKYLNLILTGPAYPWRENIRYATINSRDLRALREAGVPEENSFLLPNPINVVPTARGSEVGVKGRLAAAYHRDFPLFDPEAPLALYPVRTIRRKNVMEMALLTRLLGYSLIVTLPGVSQQERNYSAMVSHAYNEGVIRGLWGIGTTLEERGFQFQELQSAADLFVSSSVQEGFGFQFVDALRWQKPLVARDLEVLDDLRPHLLGARFYSSLQVPFGSPSLSDIRPMLKMKYQERLDRLESSLPPNLHASLEAEVSEMLSVETVDFSFLMPQMQYAYVKDVEDDDFRAEVSSLNPSLLADFAAALDEGGPGPEAAAQALRSVEQEFGYAAFVGRLEAVIHSFDNEPQAKTGGLQTAVRRAGPGAGPGPGPPDRAENQTAGSVQDALVSRFTTLDQLRLLFE